ncbi:raffinose synthase protein Sip1 [Sporothrix schenckii 1099-18]|uniref:Raffinose synthase protein Sip1 n=1 Tax=Sporothrix schenckii 1099-18 TaxID=1397361 RepID=A0A0F2LTR1_SPOSC|nr:raffinose synthase protein Sip1 [Sporothrix schenckii 1099-18]KJR80867.1 raffinose synthase protein Sip1 [Sporothrix schenckii 1099-18]
MPDGAYSFAAEFAAFLPKKPPSTARPRGGGAGSATASAMGATVSVATHPPLGQVTTVIGSDVTFYAVVEQETDKDTQNDKVLRSSPPLEVSLWHSPTERAAGVEGEDGSGWTATAFQPVDESGQDASSKTVTGKAPIFWALQNESKDEKGESGETDGQPAVVRHYYRAVVKNASGGPLHFTVRFRVQTNSSGSVDGDNSSAPAWRWVGDEQQIGDGTVIVRDPVAGGRRATDDANSIPNLPPPQTVTDEQASSVAPLAQLQDLIGDLNPAFRVTSPRSQAPGAQLWELTVPVAAVADDGGDQSAYTTVPIGMPWNGRFLRWFSLMRLWSPWLAPQQGRQALDRALDAVLCSFLSDIDGRHLVFLAISGVDHVQGLFQGGQDDNRQLVLSVRSDSPKAETATVLVAACDTFESANAAVMYHARSLVHQMATADAEEIQTLAGEVKPAWLENWYDGLGFCTWNSLGQNLSEDKIVAAVDALADHGIGIANLIIDDNWQSIDRAHGDGQFQYTWTRFEADPQQFPQGLKHAVQRVRERHPTIEHVAVWHALLGYWGGLTPAAAGGELAKTYATRVVTRAHPKRRDLPIAGPMVVVDEPDVQRFYNDFYAFLVDCGVDGVKTDAQFIIDTWTSAATRRALTTRYQDAWTVATLRHFGSRAVSCMSQTPNILFYSQLPQNRPPLLVRNSDDFFPDVPASHPWHVWTNAHNNLFTQHLNVLPDWDMFQTVHGYSTFHAAARCVSGGPIYITDTPGQHDLGLIQQMTGTSVYDKTVIFRPSVVGRSLDQYVGFHDNVLLKVGSYHGNSAGTGILGVFNVSDRRVHELVPLARVPGVDASDGADMLYVARAHTSGRITGAPVGADALLTLALDTYEYEIVSVYKVHSFDSRRGSGGGGTTNNPLHVANLGLLGKMAGAAAVVGTTYRQRDDNNRVSLQTSLKAPGILGLYVSGLAEGHRTVADSFLVTMRDQPIPAHCAAVSAQDPHVLEIDTARAWRELGFKPMMNNEVQLTIYISVDEVA